MKRVPEHLTANARALCNNATEAERKLWHVLRSYHPRFTRQLVVGRYIADLACREARLIIELDGSQHADSVTDAERTAALEAAGWHVVRFWNGEVLTNCEGVAEVILAAAAARLAGNTHPQPLPSREGRKRRRPPS